MRDGQGAWGCGKVIWLPLQLSACFDQLGVQAGVQPIPRPWFTPVANARNAAVHIVCHTFVASCLIAAMRWFEYLFDWIGELKLFGVVPLRYIFDASDALILLAFLFSGVLAATRWFKE